MSLLDDVSIVVTPNGYKAGRLYGVLPTATEGSELITNGDFATNSDWNFVGTGWSISGGSANCDGTDLDQIYQTNVLTQNKLYKVTYSITSYTSGGVFAKLGDNILGETNSAVGTYTEYFSFNQANLNFHLRSSNFDGSIDNVSVKEWTSADMDVTRATAATRVDEDGLVNYAEVIGGEEVTDGDFPSGTTAWNTGANWEILNGTANYTSGTTNSLYQSALTLTSGITYNIRFSISNAIGNAEFWTGNSAGDVNYVGGGYVNYANGDYNLYFTMPSSQTTLAFYARNVSFSIENVSVKEVTRDNVPRIDYTGGGCPHILAEPQRTNEITYSEDFSDSSWTKTGSVLVSSNSVISPDGTLNGSTITGLTGSGSNDLRFVTGLNPASTTYTSSVYLKGSGTIKMKISNNVDNSGNTTITLTSSWVRYDLTHTFNATTGSLGLTLDDSGGATATTYDIWGAQLEEGSYATSYIPTSGSTVTRNQDIFSRDGIGSLINSTEGVLFVEIAALSNTSTDRTMVSLSDGTTSNRVYIRYGNASNQIEGRSTVATANSGLTSYVVTNETDFHKVAYKWKLNEFALWIDGVQVSTTTGAVNSSDTLNKLSFDSGAGTQIAEGKVKQLQVYNTALTDEQLTSLTT